VSLDDEKGSEPCPKYLVYIPGIEAMGAGNDRDLGKFNGAEAARRTPYTCVRSEADHPAFSSF